MDKYYLRGKKAKELLNLGIHRNPYIQGSWEHQQWAKGYAVGVYEPIDMNVELEDCSDIFDKYEPVVINPKNIL